VAARVDGSTLLLEVADTGRGFGGGTSGGGTGLANIRARLSAMFGGAAEVTLARREPRGLLATLRIPMAAMPGAA
jgi:signal transduction histidine kinase